MFSKFEKLVHPYPPAAPAVAPETLGAFLVYASKGVRRYFVILALLTALIGSFEAFLFALLGMVVDWLAATPPSEFFATKATELWLVGGFLVFSIVLVVLADLVKYQALFGNFPMRLRWRFHRLMLSQSMSFYQEEFAGRIATKVMQTSLAVRDVLMTVGDILVYVLVYLITMASIMASFDLLLLIPFALWVVGYSAVLWYFVPRIAEVGKRQADARSIMTGRITDAYTNFATVKLFSHTEREASYARQSMDEFMSTVYPQNRLVSSFEVVNHTLSVLLILGTGGLVLMLWSDELLGPGAAAAALAMAFRVMGVSHWIMYEMASLFENIGTVRDGLKMFARRQAVIDQPNAQELTVKTGEIRFDQVRFAYSETQSVLENFDLVIRPGEKVGLVGPSGAGKSTLTNLMLRLYDIQGGRILIDGQDIAQVSQTSLRAAIGMVTQDTSLLHRSVRENLLYGRPSARDEEVRRAIQKAHADSFIDELKDLSGRSGLDAHVGERGVKLSGGQRQRIAIARVILKNAPILVLDEATSALDSEIEAAIQESLVDLMEGKTVVAIAHRLSTIAAMDRLIVMDHGMIVEQGTHQELLAKGGLYARLWDRQVGGFLASSIDSNN
ncbi:MAG: hypothetical protein RJA58_1327 [Pseudomonadota bacterium]